MSGFLKKICRYVKRNKKLTTCAAALIILIILFAVCHIIWAVGCAVVLLALMVIFTVLNKKVVRCSKSQMDPFADRSRIRNVDCLVIGDLCDADKLVSAVGGGTSHVDLTSPGRTLTSSYEILRHTFNILKEDSPSAVIAVQKKYMNGGYSAFDIPVFERSPISVKRLGVEDLQKKSKYLLLFYPLRSIQLLIGKKKDYPEEMGEIPPEMQEFCEERGITLHIMLR